MGDGTGTTSYAYHPAGQLGAGQVATVDGPLTHDVISYSYDELGRVVARAIDGVPLTLTYDALGRVEREVNALGTFTYAYDGATGRLATVSYLNGYDQADQLVRAVNKATDPQGTIISARGAPPPRAALLGFARRASRRRACSGLRTGTIRRAIGGSSRSTTR